MTSPWRIVFFGTPSFSVPTLRSLIGGPDDVVGVVTQPDRGKGRGRKIIPSPVKEVALERELPVLQPEKVKEEAFQERVRLLHPDLLVVVAFGQILPKSLLEIPKHGAVNVHASLLPEYRGAAPISRAILRGEEGTGVTTMRMDEGMDTGDILLQTRVSIKEQDTSETLQNTLASLGACLLIETVEKMKRGKVRPVAQDHSRATFAPALRKEEGEIDWSQTAVMIDRQVRAFDPWPGAFTHWSGKRLKVCRGETREGTPQAPPGTLTWVGSDSIEVATGEKVFILREVQIEGGKRMTVRDFMSGHPVSAGVRLG
jgi:methionyl-tRNA formyltransferase